MKLTRHTRIPRVDYPVSWPNGNSFPDWNVVGFVVWIHRESANKSNSRLTPAFRGRQRKLLQIHEVVCIFRHYRDPRYYFSALCFILSLSRVWVLFEGRGNYSRGRSREEMGTARERSRREIWSAAVPQNFRVICASSTQTALTRAKLERKLCGGRSVRAKRRNNVEAEQIRKGG